MTKRLKSKHKVDRRLKANLWGRPKVHLILEHILPDNMVKIKKVNLPIMVFSYKLNKNLKHITGILMRDNFETFIEKLYQKKEILRKI